MPIKFSGINQKDLNDWFETRLPLKNLSYEKLAEKTVPMHWARPGYYFGGLTAFAFLVQIISGIFLLIYYQPTTIGAYNSVQYITRNIPGGSLVRNLHIWSSHAMILFVLLHILSNLLMRSYRKPRELTWVSGALAFFFVLALGFSGYLLPWNTLAVYATKVGVQILAASTMALPGPLSGIGPAMSQLVAGGDSIGQATLSRFFALHVIVLPLILLAFVVVHLLLVQMHGMSVPISILKRRYKKLTAKANAQTSENPAKDKDASDPWDTKWSGREEKFFPVFMFKDIAIWMLFFTAVLILAIVLPYDYLQPFTLLKPYDALAPAPIGIKPEWYFYFLYYPLEFLPRTTVISGTFIIAIAFVLTPWIMQALPRLWRGKFSDSWFPTWSVFIIAAIFLALTFFGPDIVTYMRGALP